MENYTGVGALPSYETMQYIIHEIRKRSGKTHLAFVGEKSSGDFARYENLGLTTGTGFIDPIDYNQTKKEAINYKYSQEYSPGIEVSNDNDMGGRSYEERLHRINNSLFAYEYPSDKLASFMQMEDLFPLRYDTNTHQLMMTNPSFSTDGNPIRHSEIDIRDLIAENKTVEERHKEHGKKYRTYIRLTVKDKNGDRAYTRAYFIDELI